MQQLAHRLALAGLEARAQHQQQQEEVSISVPPPHLQRVQDHHSTLARRLPPRRQLQQVASASAALPQQVLPSQRLVVGSVLDRLLVVPPVELHPLVVVSKQQDKRPNLHFLGRKQVLRQGSALEAPRERQWDLRLADLGTPVARQVLERLGRLALAEALVRQLHPHLAPPLRVALRLEVLLCL